MNDKDLERFKAELEKGRKLADAFRSVAATIDKMNAVQQDLIDGKEVDGDLEAQLAGEFLGKILLANRMLDSFKQ